MKGLLLFGTLFFCIQLHAQNLQGVWEGKMNLSGKQRKNMHVRLELVQQNNSYFGILYSRGLEKKIIYGCDYFVTGFVEDGILNLKWHHVQRAIAMSDNDCRSFSNLSVRIKEPDSAKSLIGSWVWQNESADDVSLMKVSHIISDLTADEINDYISALYEQYANAGMFLDPMDRFMKKAFVQQVNSNDVVVEFSTIDSGKHDSIAVYLNGSAIAEMHNLIQKPLRIRLKELLTGENELLIVSNTVTQRKLNIRMKISYEGTVNDVVLQPDFVSNALVHIIRKQE